MSLFSLQAKLKIMSPIPACGEGSGSTIVYPPLSGFAEVEPSFPWLSAGSLVTCYLLCEAVRAAGALRYSGAERTQPNIPPLLAGERKTPKVNQILRLDTWRGFEASLRSDS